MAGLRLLDRFSVVLLDLNGTFMFGQDRFGPDQDYAATYRELGGGALSPMVVSRAIAECWRRLEEIADDPGRYDSFPSVVEILSESIPAVLD